MSQNEKDEAEIEALIVLLYMISDALQICEDGSADGFDSISNLRAILSSAYIRTTTLLARASGKALQYQNGEAVNSEDQDKGLESIYN
jgi:hypothetical protein